MVSTIANIFFWILVCLIGWDALMLISNGFVVIEAVVNDSPERLQRGRLGIFLSLLSCSIWLGVLFLLARGMGW